MTNYISKGAGAGIIAGIVMGLMMTMMNAPTQAGEEVPMMQIVAMVVGSTSIVVGWVYHLINSAIIGGLFGLLVRNHSNYKNGTLYGIIYGFFWWVLGVLILMPLILGSPIFSPVLNPQLRSLGMGSLISHLVFGIVLGATYGKVTTEGPRLGHERRRTVYP